MSMDEKLQIELLTDMQQNTGKMADHNLNQVIFDLNSQLKLLSSQADTFDYLVSIGSGIICGLMDIFWTGEFDLSRGRNWGSDRVDSFVKKTAKLMGCDKEDIEIKEAVKFLEDKFPIPADGNTPDFGGGLQHHLRDFAHHPTIVGLVFSVLTQFTEKSYGTDTNGMFIVVDVPEKSRVFIGKDNATKIINGTIIWFFHLVSDIAGSSSTAGLSGGTGIPGPILSMAKELSVLPVFKDISINEESLSKFLSKLFNGTLFADHDENGKIIKETVVKFDLRGELGELEELGRQALPIIANESIVRTFFFIRRLAMEIKSKHVHSQADIKTIEWKNVVPYNTPTLTRMLTISSGVFTTLDMAEAVATQKYFVAVNYVGIGRFAVALGSETVWALKRRDVKKLKKMYETIQKNVYGQTDQRIYERIQNDMEIEKLGLTEEQTEILYNLEFYKTINDINITKITVGGKKAKALKSEWVQEWKTYMTSGYASFLQSAEDELTWHDMTGLIELIKKNDPTKPWFRLVLLEAMLFEPYYPLSLEEDNKGNEIPSKKYSGINTPIAGYKKSAGDKYLDETFGRLFCGEGYVKRLRKCYDKVLRELNEVLKTALTSLAITAALTLATVVTAGLFAPAIAVTLVGSNFAGLSGAALTSACLAYLGGGAIAVDGFGMAGGTAVIVGGGAILGLGVGAGVGGITGSVSLMGKKNTILQSAKLMVSVREIFLNDEHDLEYSNTVYEQYVNNIMKIEKDLVEMRLKAENSDAKEKKRLKAEIKSAEDSVNAMKIAMKSMNKFISSYEIGTQAEE